MKKEEKIIIEDSDVRFGAGLYKLIIRIMGVIIIGMFIYNTFQLGNVAYKMYKNWNNEQEMKNYVIELSVENDVYKEFNYSDYIKEDFTEMNDLTVKRVVVETYVKIAIFEVYLIFILMFYLNVYNFLENKNLLNPFTDDSVSFLSLSIKYGFIAFILSAFLGNVIGTISYQTLVVLVLIRYIINKGREMTK